MSERQIKILAILIFYLMTTASGWMFENGNTFTIILRFFITLTSISMQWEAAHLIIRFGRKRFPELPLVKKRVKFTVIYLLLLAIFIQLITDYLLDVVIDAQPFLENPFRIITIVLQAFVFTLTTIGLFESVYYYTNFSKSELEKEELRRVNLQSQFESLKGQVNPHFLFDSLNSLSSLIIKDPGKAERFVEKMSNVYRFLLQSNEQQLITLEEELDFIQSYLHLLTTHFGGNLKMSLTIAEKYQSYLLPPLTLQMLVENAVKHNIISNSQPLYLSLFTTESDRLHMVNNLQKKTREVSSGKVGLSNINS